MKRHIHYSVRKTTQAFKNLFRYDTLAPEILLIISQVIYLSDKADPFLINSLIFKTPNYETLWGE